MSLTLVYFDIRGIAEVSRFLLEVSGAEWRDERYGIPQLGPVRKGCKESWAEDKKDSETAPFAKLPVLILENGTRIPQSHAINRYLAKRFNMYGASDAEGALIDAAYDKLSDARKAFTDATARPSNESAESRMKAIDEQRPEEKRLNIIKEQLPVVYGQLEKFGKLNGGCEEGLIGNKLSLFDVAFFYFHSRFNDSPEDTKTADDILEKEAPMLHSINKKVAEHPKIKHWLETRPVTKV